MNCKTLTIMFVDVQGYTSMATQQTRKEQEVFIKEANSFIERHIKAKNGTFVKAMGDGFLATFESPTDGVGCGAAILQEIERRNATIVNPDNFIALRIGLCTGEVNLDDSGDVFGDAVNIAARIEKFCQPNEIFISESTYLAMNRAEIKAQDLGPQRFKNVLEEVRVFKVLRPGEAGPIRTRRSSNRLSLKFWVISLAVLSFIIIMLFAATLVFFHYQRRQMQQERKRYEKATQEKLQNIKGQFRDKLRDPEFRRELRQKFPQEGRGQFDGSGATGDDSMPRSQQSRPGDWSKLCGDGICDQAETSDPSLCPKDCQQQAP